MSTALSRCRMLEIFVLLAILSGCNRSSFSFAPVHGKITVDDKPLPQCRVMFAPIASADLENPGKPAFGTTQSSGDYQLTTFTTNDGAVIGEHWVTIINAGDDLPDDVPEFDRITSPEKVKVVAGRDNKIDIKLTSDVVKKYASDNR